MPGGLPLKLGQRTKDAEDQPPTRYDQREFVYKGAIDVATIKIWLREPTNNHPRVLTRPALALFASPGLKCGVHEHPNTDLERTLVQVEGGLV